MTHAHEQCCAKIIFFFYRDIVEISELDNYLDRNEIISFKLILVKFHKLSYYVRKINTSISSV